MRLFLFIGILVFVGLLAFQPSLSIGQTPIPYGVFRGRIVDSNGEIMRGASVTVESANFTRAVKSNPAGTFGIELPVGVYKITVNKPGFATYQLTNVKIKRGGYASHVFRPNQTRSRPFVG